MTAIFAARGGARTLVLERKPRAGAKILISGGGRCNVLPSVVELDDFHTSGSRNSLRKLLHSWPLAEVRAFFEDELGIPLYREPNGKLFPRSDRARDVLEALLAAVREAGAELRTDFELRGVEMRAGGLGATLTAADGALVEARRLVLATGGLSIPKTGSDGLGLGIAQDLGLPLVPRYPALVPLLAPEGRAGDAWRELAGIALPVRLAARRGERILEERTGDFLFTHRGFSGPVVLDQSRYLTAPQAQGVHLAVAWCPELDWSELLRSGGRVSVGALLREHLPRRLAALLAGVARVDPETRLAELRKDTRKQLVQVLEACPLPCAGSEGYRKAEVTGGGVELAAVRPDSLEARGVPGLHLVGEILDVTGRIGGYNFLWAWVTGKRAGEAVGRLVR